MQCADAVRRCSAPMQRIAIFTTLGNPVQNRRGCTRGFPRMRSALSRADADSQELAAEAYGLYEQFQPVIPAGASGWGAAGTLRLVNIRKLAKREMRRQPRVR